MECYLIESVDHPFPSPGGHLSFFLRYLIIAPLGLLMCNESVLRLTLKNLYFHFLMVDYLTSDAFPLGGHCPPFSKRAINAK